MLQSTAENGIRGRATVVTNSNGVGELAVIGWELEIDGGIQRTREAEGRFWKSGTVDATGTVRLHRNVATPETTVRPGMVLDLKISGEGPLTSSGVDSYRLRVIVDVDEPARPADRERALDFVCPFKLQSGTIKYPGDT
jgi:autotransporter translocation and assembly factor TamB